MYLFTPMDPLFLVIEILSKQPPHFSLLDQLFSGVGASVKRPSPGVGAPSSASSSEAWEADAATWAQSALPGIVKHSLPLVMDVNGVSSRRHSCTCTPAPHNAPPSPQSPWALTTPRTA